MNGTSLLSPTSLTGSLRLYVIALLIVGAALPARAQVPQLPTGEEIAAPTMPMREVHLLQAVYAALQANDLAEAGKQMANAIGDEAPTAEARALQTRIRFLEARRALRERGGAGNRYTWESYLERFTQLAPELEKAAREGADDAQTQYLVGATATDHVDLAQERLSNMSQMPAL